MHKKIYLSLIGVLTVSVLVYSGYSEPHNTVSLVEHTPPVLEGMQTSSAPWIAELRYLHQRLDAIGLPALAEEGQALHIHQHIDIFIDGKPVAVPKDIGVHEAERFISPIHIHDDTAVIHIESPVIESFTLGQFFDVWGVLFTKNSIGSYHDQDDKTLKVFVNGSEIQTDPRLIHLENHQEIVITYGTDVALPHPIPSAYTFTQE